MGGKSKKKSPKSDGNTHSGPHISGGITITHSGKVGKKRSTNINPPPTPNLKNEASFERHESCSDDNSTPKPFQSDFRSKSDLQMSCNVEKSIDGASEINQSNSVTTGSEGLNKEIDNAEQIEHELSDRTQTYENWDDTDIQKDSQGQPNQDVKRSSEKYYSKSKSRQSSEYNNSPTGDHDRPYSSRPREYHNQRREDNFSSRKRNETSYHHNRESSREYYNSTSKHERRQNFSSNQRNEYHHNRESGSGTHRRYRDQDKGSYFNNFNTQRKSYSNITSDPNISANKCSDANEYKNFENVIQSDQASGHNSWKLNVGADEFKPLSSRIEKLDQQSHSPKQFVPNVYITNQNSEINQSKEENWDEDSGFADNHDVGKKIIVETSKKDELILNENIESNEENNAWDNQFSKTKPKTSLNESEGSNLSEQNDSTSSESRSINSNSFNDSQRRDYRRISGTHTNQNRNLDKRYSGSPEYGSRKSSENDKWRNDSKFSKQSERYDSRTDKTDAEFKDFENQYEKDKTPKFIKVQELQSDLFGMGKEYCLAHCVAADMSMGSGIAVQFRREFKNVDVLLNQGAKQGGLAVLNIDDRKIYYLVTKRESSGKPTYWSFWCAIKKMRDDIRDNNIKKLAIPRIGCGLDRLEWSKVKYMIEFLFKDVDVEIIVCNFQQEENSSPQKIRNCKVVHVQKPIAQIEEYTIIIYLCSEDKHVSDVMQSLNKKFNFLMDYRTARTRKGEVIRYDKNKSYILYGCVVKRNQKEKFDYESFQKCISTINKNNKKDEYTYLAYEAVKDETDSLFNAKIINILRNTLREVDVYVCWNDEMKDYMPITSTSTN